MFTGPHNFEMDKWISCAPFEKLLKIEIVEANDGKAVLKMPFVKELAQGAGLMHGGALVSLADTAVVMAIKSILPEKTHFATVRLETDFLAPVVKGFVTAHAYIEKGEKERTFNGFADIFDDNNKKILTFKSIFKIAKNSIIRNVQFKG